MGCQPAGARWGVGPRERHVRPRAIFAALNPRRAHPPSSSGTIASQFESRSTSPTILMARLESRFSKVPFVVGAPKDAGRGAERPTIPRRRSKCSLPAAREDNTALPHERCASAHACRARFGPNTAFKLHTRRLAGHLCAGSPDPIGDEDWPRNGSKRGRPARAGRRVSYGLAAKPLGSCGTAGRSPAPSGPPCAPKAEGAHPLVDWVYCRRDWA